MTNERIPEQRRGIMNEKVRAIENRQQREDRPEFCIGDTVRVHVRIREGEKERTQAFEGTVLARRGSGCNETFTVRRVSSGIGVERVFPLYSPTIASIKVSRKGKVKRGKLYYLRKRVGKGTKVKETLLGEEEVMEGAPAEPVEEASEQEEGEAKEEENA